MPDRDQGVVHLFALPQLAHLEALRGYPMIVFDAPIDNDAVPLLYECLERIERAPRLGLVLATAGGSVTTARRIALLLREYAKALTVLVPYRAASAGTLLCLGADELVMGPMTELSPIDPGLGSVWPPPPDAPDEISAEDIRAFRHMAEDWFGVHRDEDCLQVLALVAQRVFPASLSSLYRFHRLARQTAHELLAYQLPEAEEAVRARIVDQLVSGYGAHDHAITRVEAAALGLKMVPASHHEAALLWELRKTCRRQFLERAGRVGEEGVTGLIRSARFCAFRMQRWTDGPALGGRRDGPAEPPMTARISWQIVQE